MEKLTINILKEVLFYVIEIDTFGTAFKRTLKTDLDTMKLIMITLYVSDCQYCISMHLSMLCLPRRGGRDTGGMRPADDSSWLAGF